MDLGCVRAVAYYSMSYNHGEYNPVLRTISTIVMLAVATLTAEPWTIMISRLDSCYVSPLGPFNPKAPRI
jgi:hypothetical protein